MLYVKKCGTTDYGNWVLGTLKYKGFEVHDLFSVDKNVSVGNEYQVKNVELKRTRNGSMRFKLYL